MLEPLDMPVCEKPQEIVVEDCPPLSVISLARKERNHVIDSLGAQTPPPRSFWARRRLADADQWFLEVCKAKPAEEGKKPFFTQLIVRKKECRTDVYAVSKVRASS
jgi:hypothetical protein